MTRQESVKVADLEIRLSILETRMAVLETKMDALQAAVERIEHAVIGNGKVGLLTRVDRLETVSAIRAKAFWIVVSAAGSVISGVILWILKAH